MQYNITLNRAHKIVERLRQHVTDTSTALRAQAAPVRVRSQQDVGAKLRVEVRQAEFGDQLTAYGSAVDAGPKPGRSSLPRDRANATRSGGQTKCSF